MALVPNCLMGPRHVHPNVNTAEDYRQRHEAAIRKGRQMYPNLPWRDPWRVTGPLPDVFVAGGMWQLRCGCGNCPSVSPEWGVARCWDCGAVYEGIVIPRAAAIERVLLRRPVLSTRNWAPGETVADLERENAEHGVC